MVASGFLQSPQVRAWLKNVEPAWTMLTIESLNALQNEPSRENTAIRLAVGLTDDEIAASAVARLTLALLRQAIDQGGLTAR